MRFQTHFQYESIRKTRFLRKCTVAKGLIKSVYQELEIEEYAPWLVAFITLVGAGLRVYLLDSKGMWLDETFSVWLANHSVGDMLDWIVRIDQHPPLYYLLLHYWIKINGDTAYYARMLSVLFGVGTIPVLYLIGKRMSDGWVGVAAAVVMAFSPFNIRFAQETRMYTCLAFNAAVAIYALVILLTDSRSARPIGSQFRAFLHAWRTSEMVEPDTDGEFTYKDLTRNQTGWRAWLYRFRRLPIKTIETDLAWIGFILFSAAALYSHNTAVLFPLATNIFVLGLMLYQRKKKEGSPPAFQAPSFQNWVVAQAAIFLLWSPWIYAFVKQVSRVYQEFWIPEPTWDMVFQVLKSFLNENTLSQANQINVVWILYILVLILGVVYYRKRLSHFFFLAALFAVPFLGELIVSIRRPIFYDRTLIWLTIPLFLLLASGIAQLRFRVLIFVGIGVFSAINLFSAGDYYRFWYKEDWFTPAGYVAKFAEEGDLVLFNATWVQIPFDYYFKEYERLYKTQVEKHGVPLDLFEDDILEPKMTEGDIPRLLSLLDGHDRVWLVYSHQWYTDPEELIPQTLASEMALIRQRDFFGGQVQLYGNP